MQAVGPEPPQAHACPVVSIAIPTNSASPIALAVTPAGSGTSTASLGLASISCASNPSCPARLFPHAHTLPSDSSAYALALLASTAVTLLSPSTAVGLCAPPCVPNEPQRITGDVVADAQRGIESAAAADARTDSISAMGQPLASLIERTVNSSQLSKAIRAHTPLERWLALCDGKVPPEADVCDNIRLYDDRRGDPRHATRPRLGLVAAGGRRAREGAARVRGPVAARSGRAQRRERADALTGRAGGDQPDPDGRRAHRRWPGPAPVSAAAPGRGRRGDGSARAGSHSRGQQAPRSRLRGAHVLAAGPARGAVAAHARTGRRDRRARRPAHARAGQP